MIKKSHSDLPLTNTPSASHRRLSSAGLEPMNILPLHQKPSETEDEEFNRRYHELEEVVKHLKEKFVEIDVSRTGKVDITAFNVALQQLGLRNEDIHSRNTQLLSKQMADENNCIKYELFCDLTLHVEKTLLDHHHHEWNKFRRYLVGKELQPGCIRILYRFDNWKHPEAIRLWYVLDPKKWHC